MSKKQRDDNVPSGIAAHSAQRSISGVNAIRQMITRLEDEAARGFPNRTHPLDLRGVQTEAGLNARFLYGPKYKNSLKLEVEQFVASFNQRLSESRKPQRSSEDRLQEESAYWRERYLKLARHANGWHHQLRLMRRQLRDLQIGTAQVVHLHSKD